MYANVRNTLAHMNSHTHPHRNPGPKAFLSQNCQFHEAELIHCSLSLFFLLFLSLHPTSHPPLISLSNSLISLSPPAASLFQADILPASMLTLIFSFLSLFVSLLSFFHFIHALMHPPAPPPKSSFAHYSLCLPCAAVIFFHFSPVRI